MSLRARRPLTPDSAGPASPVQTKVGGQTLVEGAAVQQVAAQGVAGSGGRLPHHAAIQQAFGRHDVSGIEAHLGGAAGEAAGALGTEAYATGDHVAFAGSPSLHTAAHEAAHVVQQRGGVQLKGGISAAGDEYERHADEVADAVVQGRSAEGLLDRHAGGGGGGGSAAVQAKGGKLDATQVLPRFRSAPNQRATVMEKLPPSTGRDADGNDVAKVAFENALAGWVVTNQALFEEKVKAVSTNIAMYLERREEHIGQSVTKSLEKLTPEATTYGRMAGNEAYPDQLNALLMGGGSMHEHLLVHQMFIDKIYNQDAQAIIDRYTNEFSELIEEPLPANALKPADGPVDVGAGTMTYENAHNNARAAERSPNNIPKVKTGGLGPHSEGVHGKGEMIRGTDKFTAVEGNAFTQSARLRFNMPVSGTGLSGSATDMFTCAKLFGLDAVGDYALAAFSFFAKAGAHTFHEVMLMARSAGFNEYVPGNYISAIPEARRAKVKLDLSAHAALLSDPAAAAPEVQAADSTLHGWSDVMTLDGDVDGWGAKVKAFMATRFGVGAEAVTVTPITDGRSGDMVYRIDVARDGAGPFKGIFKVFNDADMADTEIEIGDQMRAKGVSTPANKGVARVETGADDSLSKSGVLFDLAEGETPHTLVKKIGALAVEAETRPALVSQLERAVIAVAKQLSALHGKKATPEGKAGRVEGPAAMKASEQMDAGVKNLHEKGLYELHRDNAVKNGKLSEVEKGHVTTEFDKLVQENLVKQKLRKSMTHGDANAANFIVDGDNASVIDVNTASQSLGPKGPIKTGAADTGRFLETLRTSHPGALSAEELKNLDDKFHAAYLPGRAEQALPTKEKGPERTALDKIEAEKAADEKAEVYYRACWILNQISHAPNAERLRWAKERLIELVPDLGGKLVLG